MNRILEIYSLSVCLLAVIALSVTLMFLSWNLIKMVVPEFGIGSYDFRCHQTDHEYQRCYASNSEYSNKRLTEPFPVKEELTKARLQSYDVLLKTKKRDAKLGLMKTSILFLIAVFVLLIHWRIAQRARVEV